MSQSLQASYLFKGDSWWLQDMRRFAIYRLIEADSGNPYFAAIAMREARALQVEGEVIELLLAVRRERLARAILTQREWQTKVSRRPARGRHHDSWAIREQYVRGNR